MEKGNVNGALKLLTNNMSNGNLPLDDNTIQLLHEKHPASKKANDEGLWSGGKPHPVMYESIDEDLVKRPALKTRGDSGTSGLDADS